METDDEMWEEQFTTLGTTFGWEAVHALPEGGLVGYLRSWSTTSGRRWLADDGHVTLTRQEALAYLRHRATLICPSPEPPRG